MPVKKAAATAKKPAVKAAKGDKLECGVCGMVVSIEEICGEDAPCNIICCGEPMKPKKAKVKTAK